MKTIAIITPTISRPTLRRALTSARLTPDDEWLVIGDGPQPEAEKVCKGLAILPYLRYVEGKPTGNRGNEQRDFGMMLAAADYLLFLDDDDVFVSGAIDVVRRHLDEQPHPHPIIFRMFHNGGVIWASPELHPGNVGGAMFCAPNIKDKLGRWTGHPVEQISDMGFMRGTLAHYKDLQWSGDVIVHCNPERDI